MITINDETIMIGASELRQKGPQITGQLKTKTVIILSRGEPVGVLQDYDLYKKKEEMLEELEDAMFGIIAEERMKKSDPNDFISFEKVIKKVQKKSK